MKGLSTVAFVAGLLATSSEAIQLHKRTDGPPRAVGLPIQRNAVRDPVSRDQIRRRATQQVTLDNLQTLYFANGSLGTPAQSQRLHLDTGSSDLWVNTPKSALCTTQGDPCSFAGTYSANDSSTYAYISSDFNISYVDGSGSSGDYASDAFSLGGTKLSKLQFGVGYISSSYEGILGIGYPINEVQVGRVGKQAYNNLPAQMVADGLIKSSAYSLWLNDLEASTGSILFGGVDTAQFDGTLETLPIQKTKGLFAEFLITLTALSFGSTVIAQNQVQAILLDSGSSLTYLPNAMTEALYQIVDAQYDSNAAAAYVPCSLAKNSSTLNFTFSGPKISVDMSELVIQAPSSSGRPLTFSDGTAACLFGIAPAGSSTSVLGDTFIRSAYLVYDMGNNEISIAQTKFNTTANNIVEIGTGTNSVPDSTAVANPVSASATAGSGGRIGGTATLGLGTAATATVKAGAERTALPVNLGAMAVLGVGFVFAAM